MIDVPKRWQSYLQTIKLFSPSAVIAGGALRDLETGREPKDIDVFLPPLSQEDRNVLTHMLEYRYGLEVMHVDETTTTYEKATLANVILFKDPDGGPDLNLIEMKFDSPEGLLMTFDFGICQVAYDGADIITTRHFLSDVENKTFTQLKMGERTQRRWHRLSQRYPDYELRQLTMEEVF